MPKQPTLNDDNTKAAALSILAQGLANQSEVARLAGISRQLMRHWAAEIDVDKARNAYLLKLWRKTIKRKR